MVKRFKILVMLLIMALTTGCSFQKRNVKQYQSPDGLETVIPLEWSLPEEKTNNHGILPEQIDIAEQMPVFVPESELMGTEQEVRMRVIKASDVYSKPMLDASILGNIQVSEYVYVYGKMQDIAWYKVIYNGRVAYMQEDVLTSADNREVAILTQNNNPIPGRSSADDKKTTEDQNPTDTKPVNNDTPTPGNHETGNDGGQSGSGPQIPPQSTPHNTPPNPPSGEKPNPPSGETPNSPSGEDPNPPSGETPNPPSGEDPNQPSGEDPNQPSGEDPNPPSGEDPNPPSGEDPNPPSGEDPNQPSGEDPNPPSGEDPNPPSVEDQSPLGEE